MPTYSSSEKNFFQKNAFQPLRYLKNVLYCYIENEVTD